MVPDAPRWYGKHQNMSLGSNGVDRVRSLRNDSTQLRGMNFCTSSERFAPSFIRQLNSPKWYKTHQNMTIVCNGVDRVRLSRKILMQLHGTNFCTCSARFATSFVRQPNGSKCTKMVQIAPKHEFGVQWGRLGAFVAK